MSNMKYDSQAGYISGVLVSLITVSVLLVGALGFGTWAFMSRQDYKNNSDQKAAKAAAEAKEATEAADAVKYAEEAKNPFTKHRGPDEFGAITVKYPKTWSGYVVEGDKSGTPVNDYFHPKVVPDATDKDNAYALRIQVVDRGYDSVLRTYEGAVNAKKLKASPYTLPKVKGVVGTRLDGQVEPNKQGRLIVLPMRNMTLKIWTESSKHMSDFNKIILANLTFSP